MVIWIVVILGQFSSQSESVISFHDHKESPKPVNFLAAAAAIKGKIHAIWAMMW